MIPQPTSPVANGQELKARQDEPARLRLLLAMRRSSRRAKRVRAVRVGFSLAVAVLGPLASTLNWLSSDTVGAIAGGWVIVALLLAPLERRWRDRSVRCSEEFDCAVFGLPWEASNGRPVSPERIADLSNGMPEAAVEEKLPGWYVVDDALSGHLAVLVCQRSACVYSQRLHWAYLWIVGVAAAAAVVVVLLMLAAQDLVLGDFLVGFALPALAGVVVVDELVRTHRTAWEARERFEESLFAQAATGYVSWEQLRRHQDTQFRIRSLAPPLPEWLYKAARGKNEAAMAHSAEEFGNALKQMGAASP